MGGSFTDVPRRISTTGCGPVGIDLLRFSMRAALGERDTVWLLEDCARLPAAGSKYVVVADVQEMAAAEGPW